MLRVALLNNMTKPCSDGLKGARLSCWSPQRVFEKSEAVKGTCDLCFAHGFISQPSDLLLTLEGGVTFDFSFAYFLK